MRLPEFIRPEYVPREAELRRLQEMLIEERRNAVLVIGGPAVGKSVLLTQFIDRYGPDFGGGVRFVSGLGVGSSELSVIVPSEVDDWTLLAVDGLDEWSAPMAWRREFEWFARFPRMQIIATTRPSAATQLNWPTLQLGGMHRTELEQLVSLKGLQLPPSALDTLFAAVQGNPLLASFLAESLYQRDPATRTWTSCSSSMPRPFSVQTADPSRLAQNPSSSPSPRSNPSATTSSRNWLASPILCMSSTQDVSRRSLQSSSPASTTTSS